MANLTELQNVSGGQLHLQPVSHLHTLGPVGSCLLKIRHFTLLVLPPSVLNVLNWVIDWLFFVSRLVGSGTQQNFFFTILSRRNTSAEEF